MGAKVIKTAVRTCFVQPPAFHPQQGSTKFLTFNQNRKNMGESWNKKEREKKRQKSKQEKAERKQERKEQSKDGKSLDDMMAYLDENGNLTSTPPDPGKRVEFKLEDIEIGVPKQVPLTEAELTRKGRVSFFNDAKGFGFIKDLASQESVFVHINNLTEKIGENDQVTFQVEMGQRGPSAVNVKKVK